MTSAMMVAAHRFLPCMSAAVGLVLLVFPLPWIHSAGFQEDFDVYLGNALLEGFCWP